MGFQFINEKKVSSDTKSCLIKKKDNEDSKYSIVSAYRSIHDNITSENKSREDICYSNVKAFDSGSFGIVYEAELLLNENSFGKNSVKIQRIAIKKVLQDKRYKNRELETLKFLRHRYIINLLYYFYSIGENTRDIYLNLIMEFLPYSCYKVL